MLDALRIAVRQNIAANGRLYCSLLAAFCVLYSLPLAAFASLLAIGLAVPADELSLRGRHRLSGCVASIGYGLTFAASLLLLLKLLHLIG